MEKITIELPVVKVRIEDPYFGGRIKDLQEMLEDDEVLIITKTNFLTMTKR